MRPPAQGFWFLVIRGWFLASALQSYANVFRFSLSRKQQRLTPIQKNKKQKQKTKNLSRKRLLLPLTLLFTAPVAHAEVYKLVPGAGLCERLGYDLAYTAPVDINGTKATVYVWHSDANIHRTLLKVQDAHRTRNHPEGFAADKGTGFGMVVDGTTLIRYLAVTLDEVRDTTVLYQTNCALADFMAGASGPPGTPPLPPRNHKLDAIPVPGNATPVSHATDNGTGMAIEVSTLPERHALVLSWYERTMPGRGWIPGPKSAENTQLYVRGRERAMISIAVGEKETTLTRVHHQRGSFFK